ncbi:MAG TPA: hypothetical protein DCY40_05985 [Actinobacteria bacterium]|nr:hypothetical protein [Actinomycetota bacterium]
MLRIVTPPAETPQAIAPADAVARWGGDLTRVTALVEDATRIGEQIARCRWIYRDYEALVEGDRDERLWLPVRPVAAVALIHLDGDADETVDAGTEDDEYEIWPEDGSLRRRVGWMSGGLRWRVRFTAGYWLPASMAGALPAGAASIDVEGRHVRRAIEEIVQTSIGIDRLDRTVKSDRIGGLASVGTEYDTGIWVPKGAERTLRSLGSLIA